MSRKTTATPDAPVHVFPRRSRLEIVDCKPLPLGKPMPLLAEDPGEAFPNPIIARLLLAATFPENVVKLPVSSRGDV